MKLKDEFNLCNASTAAAGGSEVSNAVHPSTNPADQAEGTQPRQAASVHHVQRAAAALSLQINLLLIVLGFVWFFF